MKLSTNLKLEPTSPSFKVVVQLSQQMQLLWRIKLISLNPSSQEVTLLQTFLRYVVNCGIAALMGLPLFLIYVNSKNAAVNDTLSKTRLIKVDD